LVGDNLGQMYLNRLHIANAKNHKSKG
jgi:hypothetical protein